jgi:hypothetical protein
MPVEIDKLLESPYTALIIAVIFGALALSGKFSVTFTHVCLAMAWAVIAYAVRNQPLQLF